MRRRDCKDPSDPIAPRGAGPAPRRAVPRSLTVLLVASGLLAGCGQPIITFRGGAAEPGGAGAEPASTGSIARRPASFGKDLGDEDWRRAHAALAVALDPQGNGRPVRWDNPDTAMRGSVNPTGLPYVSNDEICRDFLASVITPRASRFVRGTGCKPSGGAWELRRLRAASRAA